MSSRARSLLEAVLGVRPTGATPAAGRASQLVRDTAERNLRYVLEHDPGASQVRILEAVTEAQRYNPWPSLQEAEAANRMRRELAQRLEAMLQHRYFPRRANPRRRRRPTHTAVFDRCVKEVGSSAGNPYAVCQSELGSRALRRRRRNPRRGAQRPAFYTISAYKPRRVAGERVIRELYFTGDKFSRRPAGIVKFPTRELAAKFARYLSRTFGRPLKGWRLRVS